VCSSRRNLSAMYHIDPSEAFTQLLPAYVNMKWITRALSGILTPVCKESTVRSPKSVHHDCHNTGHTRSGWHGGACSSILCPPPNRSRRVRQRAASAACRPVDRWSRMIRCATMGAATGRAGGCGSRFAVAAGRGSSTYGR
jgi:hypothetical protein